MFSTLLITYILLYSLFFVILFAVAAKWPPDTQSRFYPQHWPRHYFDDIAYDSRSFGNEKSIDGNGNALFGKAIADEIALPDLLQANDVEVPADERRQRQLQWLGSWLFGQKQKQAKQTKQQPYLQGQLLLPPAQAQKQQQQSNLNGLRMHDADIVIYKKAPEIVPGDEAKQALETEASENDVADAKMAEEHAQKQDMPLDTVSDYDYKSDMDSASERFNTQQPPPSKRVPYARRNRSFDYAYIPYTAYQHDRERELSEAKKLAFKRNKTGNGDQRNFLPSISAGE